MFRQSKKEEGAALLTAIFITTALLAFGTIAALNTNVELNISKNDRLGREAFFIADSGCPLASRVLKDMILREGINAGDYIGFTFNSNFISFN